MSSKTVSEAGVRVLALHGKGGSASSMARTLEPLVKATESYGWRWTFATAPHEICASNTQGGSKAITFTAGSAWWTLPPGVRSFEAESFEGIDESMKVLELCWKENGPFDCLLGHSQGAMLTAVLVAKAMEVESKSLLKPKCAIISGAAWPNPYGDLITAVASKGSSIPTLHCWGIEDTVNPPEMAQKLKCCFAASKELEHDGGHIVPVDVDSIERMISFVNEAVSAALLTDDGNLSEVEEEREWGISYLGGDPCSSNHNTDPFDEQDSKPDAWEDMKKRIQAIVDRDRDGG